MKKLFFTLSTLGFIVFAMIYSCGHGEENKAASKSDSISLAMDSSRANDTLLQRLSKDTNHQNQTQ